MMSTLHLNFVSSYLKKAFSIAFLFIAVSSCVERVNAQTTLAGWDVNGLAGGTNSFGTSPYAATTTGSNLTVGGLTRGSGVSTTGSAAARAWGGVNWQGSNEAGAISLNEFVTFTVTPNAGYVTSINSVTLSYRRSGTGPSTGELQYSTNGTTFTDAASISYTNTSSSGATLSAIDLSAISDIQNITSATTVTFRIVNWGGTSSSGTWYVFDVANSTASDLIVSGNTVLCPGLITGTTSVCTGATTSLSDTSSGGTWVSGSTSVAAIGSTGIVTGVTAGTATITYTTGCGTTTTVVTVNPTPTIPSLITGTLNVCVGNTTTLNDVTAGGTWSSGSTGIATAGSTGIITGVSSGSATISYTVTNGCGSASSVATVTVNAAPATPASITGTTNVCVGSAITLSNTTLGGTWSSSDGTTATVGSTGIVTGIASGAPTVSYSVVNACGSTYATTAITVNPLPVTPSSITGTLNVCPANTITLGDVTAGGIWSSSNANATVGSISGIVTGATAGTSTISYAFSNSCGTASATAVVTINPLPSTPSSITGTLNVCAGSTTSLSNSAGGGIWSSVTGTTASIGTSGIVTAIAAGTSTISYTITNSCGSMAATAVVTVNPLPNAGAISGSTSVVTGGTTTLTDGASGGVWTSTSTSIATIGSVSGSLTGVALGTSVISYTVTNGCGTNAATVNIAVVNPSFTRGNLVVLKSGDGSAALSSAATAVFAVEYTTSGSATGFSVALPTATVSGVPPITISGSASSEGQMTMSAERDRLILEGYNGVAGTASIVNTAASANAREIFSINSSGTYALGVSSSSAYSANNIRSATASGTNYFSAGTASSAPNGIVYLNSNTSLATTPTNTRVVQIFNGQTYFSASSSPFLGVAKMGTGIPTTSGQTAAQINTTNDGSSYGFSLSPDGTTLYIADDAAGILKYTGSGTSFAFTYTVNATPVRGLVVDYSGSNPVIYATTTASSANSIIKITDGGSLSTASTIATAATNTGFRGIQFAPSCFASVASLSSSAICSGTGTSIVIKGNPTATVSYNINGGTTLTSTIGNNGQDTIATGTLTGNATYNLLSITTTACSSVSLSGSVTVTVSPLPSSISGTTSVCTSGTTTLGNTFSGGVWTSGSTSVATVGSITGIVTGITTGTATITYALSCGPTTTTVTVNTIPSTPSSITGTLNVCPSATTTFTDATTGGSWSSTATGTAAVGSTGIVTGVSAGTATISYTSTNACGSSAVTAVITVNPLPATPGFITGVVSVCVGNSIALDNSVGGGVWTSASTGIATVGTSGSVTGISAGSAPISYTISNTCGSASVLANVTVNTVPASPAAIFGYSNVCPGSNITLSDATPGGVWSSSATGTAIVGTSGIVSGVLAGTASISYTVSNTCGNTSITTPVTVNSLPSAITGTASACVGANTTLSDGTTGGAWSSSDITKATVGSGSGTVTGVAYGNPVITYTLSTGCSATQIMTINATSAGVITGSSTICNGGNVAFSDTVTGGAWSSNNTSIAAIGSISGVATGTTLGIDTIVYSVTNMCGSYSTTMPVTVSIAPPAFTITPALVSLCPSSPAQLMTAIGDTITGSVTIANGSTTFTEPQNAADSSAISVSGIPVGATITSVAVSFTVSAKSSGEQRDNIFNLRAPNGHIVNLDNGKGSSTSGLGFNNVTISSAGTVALSTASMTTGTQYIASLAAIGTPTAIPAAYRSTDIIWANLYSVPNGQWTLITDNSFNATEDTLKSWSITIKYAINPSVAWSSTTGLYTNAGATTAYTGGSAASVYVLPSSSTSYIATATIGSCSKTATVPVNVGSVLYVPSVSGASSLCPGGTISLTDSTTGGNWSVGSSAIATIGSLSGVVTGVSAGTTNITYTYSSGSCTGSAVKTITVNSLPTVAAIGGTTNLCLSSTPTSTLTDATSGGTFAWSSSNSAVAIIGSASGSVTGLVSGSATITYSYNNGICSNMVTTSVIVANTPTAVSVSPLLASLCSSSPAQMLTALGGIIPGSTTISSGTISFAATNTSGGSSTSLTMSGVPAGAVVTGIAVNYNATESFDGDFELNLEAPNASVINLFSSGTSNNGPNFVNTTISSAGTTAIPNSGIGAPWTGVWAANASLSTTVGSSTLPPTTSTWGPLESANPNGTWTLIGRTNFSGNTATVTSWSLTVFYNYQAPVSWSSVTGLYTNSGATTAYTGTSSDTVYAKPAITTTYTATASNGGCTSASNVNVNVGTSLYVPVITGLSKVCAGLTDTLADSVSGGTWTSSNTSLATIGSISGVVTAVTAGTPVLTYTYNSGSCTGFATKIITVNALPAVSPISGPGTVCSGATITMTDATTGGSWSSGAPAVATIGSAGIITQVSVGTTAINYAFSDGTCTNVVTTTVNSLNTPSSVSVTPSSAITCTAGPATQLNEVGGNVAGSVTFSTSVPQTFGSGTSGVSPISVTGIPTGANITGLSVVFNASQSGAAWDNDDIFNLQAPNGHIINLVSLKGGSGSTAGFVNTTISSTATTSIPATGAPYTGIYAADTVLGTGASGYPSDSTTWSSLFSTGSANGTWNFVGGYIFTSGTTTINSWSITVNYTVPAVYTWSSTAGLYANSGATTAYTGTNTTAVYAMPSSITTYTVTASNGACTSTGTATVSVNPSPAAISGIANVCIGAATSLTDVTGSGVWSSSDNTLATVGSTGIVNGIANGVPVITYTLPSGCSIQLPVTVNPLPLAISGVSNICLATSASFTDASAGGSWSSSNATVATVGSSTGLVSGIAAGNSIISYTLPTGCTVISPLTINSLPAAIAGTTLFCTGYTTLLTDATGGGSWSSSNSAVASIGSGSGVVNSVTSGAATISYTLSGGCNITLPITVNTSPVSISGVSNVCVGSSISLVDLSGGGSWSSSNTSQATIGSAGVVSALSAGTPVIGYALSSGCSASLVVTVSALPSVYTVAGGGFYCAGSAGPHILLSGSDAGASYQLYFGSAAVGTAILGSGSAIDFGAQTVTGSYTVIATNSTGLCTSSMSGSVSVSINPVPAVFAITGGGSFCTGGSGVHIGLSSSFSGISYQLYNFSTPVGSAVTGSGTSIDFGLETATGQYNVIATNTTTGCTSSMTGPVAITVNPLPTSYVVSGGGSYCIGGTGVHVFLNNSTIGVNYQLYNSTTAIGSPVSGTSGLLDFGLQTALGAYTVVGTNLTTGCVANMSGSVTVTTNALPVTFSMTGGGGYCSGSTGSSVGLSGSISGTTYQLYLAGSPVGSVLSGSGSALNFGLQTAGGSYTVIATNTATGCANSMTGVSTVSINGLPSAYTVIGGGAYCSGGTGVSIGLNGSESGVNYRLSSGGSFVGSSVSGTGASISFGSTFTTAGSYTVVATNSITGCTGNMTGSAFVSINPLPAAFVISSSATSYCAGGSGVDITLGGSVPGINYYLYDGGSIVNARSGTGAVLDYGIEFAGGTYTAVATNTVTGCSGNMTGSAVITVNPLPNPFNVTGGGNYCVGTTAPSVGLSSSNGSISYQLYLGGVALGTAVSGTGGSISFGAEPAVGAYTVVATNSATGCFNNMTGSVAVNTLALPNIYSVTGGGAYCIGGAGSHVMLAGSDAGTTYKLYDGASIVSTAVGTGSAIDFGSEPATGTYTVVALNGSTSCSANMLGSTTVSLSSLPVAVPVTGGGNYCPGGFGVPVGLSSSTTGVNYQLYRSGAIAGSAVAGTGSAIGFGLQTITGAYTVVATNATTGCTNNMASFVSVGLSPLPVVYAMSGGGNFCAGGTGVDVGLSGSATGISYQLYNGGTAVPGAVITGSGSVLDFGVQSTTGIYTVKATDHSTTCSVTMGGSAVVNTNPLPVAYSIAGGGNYCTGGAGTHIGLRGSDIGISYQLYLGASLVGLPISGTGVTLDFGLQTVTGNYSVIATNGATSCVDTMSGIASINTIPLPASHNITGGGSYCPGGTGAHIGLDGSDAGISYQLYSGGVISGSAVAGTGSPIDFGYRTATGLYSVIASSLSTTCTNNMAGSATINISALPASYSITGGGNYCAGGTGAHIGLGGSQSSIAYQLYNGTTPVGLPVAGTSAPIDFGLEAASGTYTVVAQGIGTACLNNMIGNAVINVSPLPAAHHVTGGGNYCIGGVGVHLGLDGSETGISYQLYNGSTPVTGAWAGTGSALDFGLQTTVGSYNVIATNTTTSCTGAMSGSQLVVVNALPGVYTVTGGGHYCVGGPGSDISLSRSDAGINYQLYNGSTPVGIAIPGTGSPLDFGLQAVTGTYKVVATNTTTTCTSTMAGTTTIATDPAPVNYAVTNGGGYCAGGAGVRVSLAGSNTGISYQLYRDGSSTGAPVAGTGFSLDFSLQTIAGNYSVIATNSSTSCTKRMADSVAVIINPLPTPNSFIGGASAYCAGGAGIDLSLTGSQTGVNYQLYNGTALVGSLIPGTGGSINFGYHTAGGAYTVVGVNASTGCLGTMPGSPFITINPLPNAYPVDGGGSYCSGGTGVHVGLSNSNTGIQYQLYRSGTAVGSSTAGTGIILDLGPQTGSGTYSVIATNSATGCTNNMTGIAIVTTNALPVAYTVTGGGSFCSGASGVHVGLSGSAIGVTYQVYASGGLLHSVAGTGLPLDFGLETIAGTYNVSASNSTTGCTADMGGSVIVNINALPVLYAVSGGGSFCQGGAGVDVNLPGSGTGVFYSLYKDGVTTGLTMPGSGTIIDFGRIAIPGTYTVQATDRVTGCAVDMPGAAVVIVNPLPVAYSVEGGGSYCAGSAGVHIGMSNSQTGVSYQLYNGSSISGSPVIGTGGLLDMGVHTVAGTYRVIATNNSTTCTNSMSDSAIVTITTPVVPFVSISTGRGDTVCAGNLITFTATPVNGGSAPSYLWTINGVSVTTGNMYSYLPNNGDVVGVTMTSTAACASPAIATADMSMVVEANGIPSILISADPGVRVCEGSIVNYTSSVTNGGSGPSYTWMKNGSVVGTASTYSYVPVDGDMVYCVLASNYHCRIANTASSNHLIMAVDAAIPPVVVVNADPGLDIALGQTLTLSATISGGGSSPYIQWYINSQAIAGASGNIFSGNTFRNLDQVTCKVISNDGCAPMSGEATVTVHITNVGVAQVSASFGDIQLIPNPNNGTFTLKGTLGSQAMVDKDVQLEITNMLGQTIYTENVATHNGVIDRKIQLNDLPANGMYILTLHSGDENKVFHMVIER